MNTYRAVRPQHFAPFLARPDMHGGPLLPIPSKDNGLDIEGLVVSDMDRVFLGLRGPVLRGYAALLDMRLTGMGRGLLEPKRSKKGSRSAKHFLNLDGLGIRELRNFLDLAGDSLLDQEPGVLEPLFDIPHVGK